MNVSHIVIIREKNHYKDEIWMQMRGKGVVIMTAMGETKR